MRGGRRDTRSRGGTPRCAHTHTDYPHAGGGRPGSPPLLACSRGSARLFTCSPHATGGWQTRRRWLSHRTRASHSDARLHSRVSQAGPAASAPHAHHVYRISSGRINDRPWPRHTQHRPPNTNTHAEEKGEGGGSQRMRPRLRGRTQWRERGAGGVTQEGGRAGLAPARPHAMA